ELGAQRRIAVELLARDLLGDVRLHVLLLLEGRVEQAPLRERVRRRRIEQVDDEADERLPGRHEDRALIQRPVLARPRAHERGAGAALERWIVGDLRRAERLQLE